MAKNALGSNKASRITRSKPSKKRLVILGVVLFVVAIAGYGLLNRYLVQHRQIIPSTNQTTSPQGTRTSAKSTANQSSAATNDAGSPASTKGEVDRTSTQPTTTDSSAAPDQPHGTFISNHHPNLGGSPAPSSETSICLTTPGATCSITFTKGGQTKSLSAQTTGSDGSTSWSWDVNSAGMTAGSWQVTATAKLNSQTVSVQDPMTLEVNP